MMRKTNSSSLKYIKVKGEAKQETFMIEETIRIDIDQIVEIEESNLVVEFSTDKIIEVGSGMDRIQGRKF